MDASVLNRLDEIETAAQKVRAQTEDRKRELEKAADQKTAAFDAQIDAHAEGVAAEARTLHGKDFSGGLGHIQIGQSRKKSSRNS